MKSLDLLIANKLTSTKPVGMEIWVFGEFEAYIDESGRVKSVVSHHEPIEGNDDQKRYIFPIIREWQFAPTTFKGNATPVYMWIGLSFE